ncbi:MAG: hypothetical protein NTZ33_13940 [Bacteroidetes bacterium]|nr:hypothetical protein [Bacteroidota bacterium]
MQQYKLNTANFAAYKSYKVTDEIKAADPKLARQIINKYNRFQAAEYNTVVSRSRTAKQFDTFQQEKHLYPNLTWLRTRSANPRELHLSYVGISLPINDPFWTENQPGNLWNCKCDWKTTDAEVTPVPDKIIKPARGLEGNPYETGELFTNKHPYFKVSEETASAVDKFIVKQIRDENTKAALTELRKNDYTLKLENKVHPLVFSRDAIKHLFHNTHTYQSLKDMSIPYLPEIIKIAEMVKIKPAVDNPMVKRYIYYKYDILDKPAFINVRESINGDLTIYSITPSIK